MVDAAIIGGLLTNLVPLIRDEFSLFSSFEKDVEKLSNKLSLLNAVLEDDETKFKLEKKDKQTEDWLRKLKVVANEVRDIMDDCTFEDLRLRVKRLNASSSTRVQVFNCIAQPFSNCTLTHLKIGHKIKDVLEKLDQFSSDRLKFQLPQTTRDSTPTSSRETMSNVSGKVYGRDEEKEKIVHILVNTSRDALSVLPILGLGGLGKTTLAQMVFNDEEITKCFDVKFWVCVSENFDIMLVIKAILEETKATTLEKLRKEIQDKLRGKKYLIVLDDVWNENIEEWNRFRSILIDCGSNGAFILTTTRKRNVAKIMEPREDQHFKLSALSDDNCWQVFEERAFTYGIQKTTNFIGLGKEIAKKCKGVPLVAKILGGQLGFKSDEKEWRRVRDSEMWEISKNKESISPILELSYYDLSYPLRRCFAFCAIFPKDTEIEKERLIQMWIAHDLIPINTKKEEEICGNNIWDALCWRSFFQDEKEERILFGKVKRTCKMHDFMHDLAQSVMKDECFTLDANSSSKAFRSDIRHITIMVNSLINVSIDSLKKIGGLQSIILHPHNKHGTFSKKILSVLKKFSYLRVFEVPSFVQREDLRYVGCLKHLRYLDLSSNLSLKTLPNSICDLLNLQTLKLNGCHSLKSLPRNMKDLINLQHLYLDSCWKLRYMPGGMGRLKGLKTLSLVVVGKKKRDCQLDEFKDLEIGGCLEIRNLERVSDASIERGISMAKMSSIYYLDLKWEDNDETNSRHEKIGEALEVSSSCLKILSMEGYKGVNIPKWVEKSSATLTELGLWAMDNVEHLFTMNNMNTSSASRNDMNEISEMKNLIELVSPPISTIRAFPNLRKIEINGCPKLGALPPPHHLKSLKDVTVDGECSDKLFDSISDLSGQLTRLSLRLLNERSVIFPAAGSRSSNDMNGTVAPLLEELYVSNMENLRELVSPPRIPITSATSTGSFPNLGEIEIYYCPKLALPPPHDLKSLKVVKVNGECTDELLYSIPNLSALTYFYFAKSKERSVLFGGGDNDDDKISVEAAEAEADNDNINELAQERGGGGAPAASSTFQSFRCLTINECSKLSCLFDEKLARGGGGDCLKNLNDLCIWDCPELMISVEQWRNITHCLKRLNIFNCPKLVPSKVEEAEEVMTLLRSLPERLGRGNVYLDILKEEQTKSWERLFRYPKGRAN